MDTKDTTVDFSICPACGSHALTAPVSGWFLELRALVHALPPEHQSLPSRWLKHTIRQSVDCSSGEDLWSDSMHQKPGDALNDCVHRALDKLP